MHYAELIIIFSNMRETKKQNKNKKQNKDCQSWMKKKKYGLNLISEESLKRLLSKHRRIRRWRRKNNKKNVEISCYKWRKYRKMCSCVENWSNNNLFKIVCSASLFDNWKEWHDSFFSLYSTWLFLFFYSFFFFFFWSSPSYRSSFAFRIEFEME